jgi:hypothetical protein
MTDEELARMPEAIGRLVAERAKAGRLGNNTPAQINDFLFDLYRRLKEMTPEERKSFHQAITEIWLGAQRPPGNA